MIEAEAVTGPTGFYFWLGQDAEECALPALDMVARDMFDALTYSLGGLSRYRGPAAALWVCTR
jgi:hypothetical protein